MINIQWSSQYWKRCKQLLRKSALDAVAGFEFLPRQTSIKYYRKQRQKLGKLVDFECIYFLPALRYSVVNLMVFVLWQEANCFRVCKLSFYHHTSKINRAIWLSVIFYTGDNMFKFHNGSKFKRSVLQHCLFFCLCAEI